MNLPVFECDQCGACCRELIVEIDELDIAREGRLKGVAKPFAGQPGWEYVDDDDEPCLPLVPGFENGAMLACGSTFPCGMLSTDNRCSIYDTRPNVCVAFRAGSSQCQSARGMAKLEPLEPRKDDDGDAKSV